MNMRAMANQQRHPVVYRVLLDTATANKINKLLAKGLKGSMQALITIKRSAIEVELARGNGANLKHRWDMIPNPKLDPMYSGS
jgi:hypothetical protein